MINSTRKRRQAGDVSFGSLFDELSTKLGSHMPRSSECNGCPVLPGIYGFLPQRSHHQILTPREMYEIDRNTVYECIVRYGFKSAADEFGYNTNYREFAQDYIVTMPRLSYCLDLPLSRVVTKIGLLDSEARAIFAPPQNTISTVEKAGRA